MPDIPRTSQYRNCLSARTGHASLPRQGKGRACPLTGNRARSALLQHAGPPGIAPEKFRDALLSALGRDVRLVRMDLPPGCSAAWFGGIRTDWIAHAGSTLTAAAAVAHAAGHLSLLHCGRVRDGGQFACVDTRHGQRDIAYRVHLLLGGGGDLPSPLFTTEEELAASSFATALLAQCGYPDEVPAPLDRTGLQNLQCLG